MNSKQTAADSHRFKGSLPRGQGSFSGVSRPPWTMWSRRYAVLPGITYKFAVYTLTVSRGPAISGLSRLIEGRLRRRSDGGAGSGVRVRLASRRAEARDPARQGSKPGREELRCCPRPRRKCREAKRGPEPKIATVERRKASAPRVDLASRREGARRARYMRGDRGVASAMQYGAFSALRSPRFGGHGNDGCKLARKRGVGTGEAVRRSELMA
jgi:hypothetical protein